MPFVSRYPVQGALECRAASKSRRRHADALPLPEKEGSCVETYIIAVNRLPMLTAHEEMFLSSKVHKEKDSAAARQLIISNLRFVVPIARSYLGYRQSLDDLIQEGNMGLIKAVHRFQPTPSSRLIHLATSLITTAIRDCIVRLWHLVPAELTRSEQELFFRLPQPLREGWLEVRGVELRSLAATLRTRPEVLRRLQIWLAGKDIPLNGQEWSRRNYRQQRQLLSGSDVAAVATDAPEELEHQLEAMHHFLNVLAPRSRDILAGRWLTQGPRPRLREFALRYGISRERARQIEHEAFNSIMAQMRPQARGDG